MQTLERMNLMQPDESTYKAQRFSECCAKYDKKNFIIKTWNKFIEGCVLKQYVNISIISEFDV